MSLLRRNNGNLNFRTLLSDFSEKDPFFNRFFRDLSYDGEWVPAVNILESEKDYTIELSAPGLKKEDFKVDVENGILNVSAEAKEEKEEKRKNYTRQEYRYDAFSRSFTLPENASEEQIGAKYEDGILKLTLAKKVPAPAQKRKAIAVA